MTATAAPSAATDVAAVLATLREGARTMATTTAAERRARLERLRAELVRRRLDLAAAAGKDLGRPPFETELTEVHHLLGEIDHACRHLASWMRPRRVPSPLLLFSTTARLVPEPKGVVLILAPWNYPIGMVLGPLIGVVAAGNTACLKPSEKAPHTAALLGEIVRACFDPREVALVEGTAEVAQALTALPFDHVCFTGSPAVARHVMAAAARNLVPVTLELGGKSPAIVAADADVPRAAERIVHGRFMNAGQTCVAPDYAYVHASRLNEFLAAVTDQVARMYGASEAARRANPDLGRMVDGAHFERLRALIEGSVALGARVEFGAVFDAGERYVAPTVLSAVTPEMPVMAQELFGPVLPVLGWHTVDEAARFIRTGGKPLGMYVFTRDRAVCDAFVRGTAAGAVVWNDVGLQYLNANVPFGGIGESGMGAYHGERGFREFSHAKPVIRQWAPSLVGMFAPPYRGRHHELARKVFAVLEWLRR